MAEDAAVLKDKEITDVRDFLNKVVPATQGR